MKKLSLKGYLKQRKLLKEVRKKGANIFDEIYYDFLCTYEIKSRRYLDVISYLEKEIYNSNSKEDIQIRKELKSYRNKINDRISIKNCTIVYRISLEKLEDSESSATKYLLEKIASDERLIKESFNNVEIFLKKEGIKNLLGAF